MEQLPADARAAPSASEPNDIVMVMDIASSPKRPRDPGRTTRLGRQNVCSESLPEEDGHHECRAAATAARTCGALGESPGSARGRPSLCTSVTVIDRPKLSRT
eukprot:scaffold12009_cov101-Isochrysis_galbana.AAC.4